MSMTTEHLRRALQRIDPGIRVSEFGNFMPYERAPYREPPPLSDWTRADPLVKLLVIVVVVASCIALLALP